MYSFTDHASATLSTGLGNIRLSYTEDQDPRNPNELIILDVQLKSFTVTLNQVKRKGQLFVN